MGGVRDGRLAAPPRFPSPEARLRILLAVRDGAVHCEEPGSLSILSPAPSPRQRRGRWRESSRHRLLTVP